MIENLKSEHPESELLVAFVEKTLTAPERDTVMMHLADCPECRELLFLAQQGLPDEEMVAATPPRTARTGWLNWRVAAVTACLLATVGVLTEQIYQRSHSSSEAVARVTPAPLPQAATNEVAKNTSVPPQGTSPTNSPKDSIRTPQNPLIVEKEASSFVSDAPKNTPPASGVSGFAAPGQTQVAQQEDLKNKATEGFKLATPPQPQVAAQQDESARTGLVLKQAEKPQFDPSVAQNPDQNKAVHGATMRSSAQTVEAHPLVRSAQAPAAAYAPKGSAVGGTGYSIQQAAPGATAETMTVNATPVPLIDSESQNILLKTLPNGQAAQTSVTILGKMLALDQNGRLFVSADLGATWREIQKQWSGNAIKLSVIPYFANAEAGKTNQSAYSSGSYAVVLRNSTNEEWISIDAGATWKPMAK